MSATLLGRLDWGCTQTDDWFREYTIKWLIEVDSVDHGPAAALACPSLPSVFSPWIFGSDNDPWAYCWPSWTASQLNPGNREPCQYWTVEQKFSSKPFPFQTSSNPTNPLATPPQCSGSFVKYTREAQIDKDGKAIRAISGDIIRGKSVEFDANRPTVAIELTMASLGLNIFSPMIDTVNDSSLWGLGTRRVKLSNARWTRNLYGYSFYYTLGLDFDIDFKTFDRIIPQCGYKTLMTGGTASNPAHWEHKKDTTGFPTRNVTYYNADGTDYTDITAAPATKTVQYYTESNFLTLGIPTSF